MKKMFFTAIALIAFTGTSMANTKEYKKEIKKEKINTKKISSVLAGPCSTLASNTNAALLVAGYSEAAAMAVANDVWSGCMCSTWNFCGY